MFKDPTKKIGSIKLDSTYKIVYSFKNIGDGDLIIDTATSSCECAVVSLSKKNIASNDSSNIIVSFKRLILDTLIKL